MTQVTRHRLYRRHRFPAEVIAHAVWLYFRFPLSLRMVEQIDALRRKHSQDRRILARDIAQSMRTADQMERMQTAEKDRSSDRAYRGLSL